MSLFAKKAVEATADVLGKTLGVIDKAVTDKDLKNQLQQQAAEAHINNTMSARKNTSGVARWVRASIAILGVLGYIGVNYFFLQFIFELDAGIEIKITFFYKLVSDVLMVLMVILGFYFGSSDHQSTDITDIKKTVKQLT